MKYLKRFDDAKIALRLRKKVGGSIQFKCHKYNIHSYTMNDDGSIDVGYTGAYSHVDFSKLKLDKIPLRFNSVCGSFNCSENDLTTLKGSPKYVRGGFDCSKNKMLKSLDGGPRSVHGVYNFSDTGVLSFNGVRNHNNINFNFTNTPIYEVITAIQYIVGKNANFRDMIDPIDEYEMIRGNNISWFRSQEMMLDIYPDSEELFDSDMPKERFLELKKFGYNIIK